MMDYREGQGQQKRRSQDSGKDLPESLIQPPVDPNQPTPDEIYQAQRAQILQAWQTAAQVDGTRVQATIDSVMANATNDAAAQQGTYQMTVLRARELGLINVREADALLANIQARGQANLAYLTERGRNLLQSLTEREAGGLQNFIEQAIYDLDRNRQITGPDARPGYSGVNRFAVTVDEQDAMNLPGYAAMQDGFAQQRADAQRMNATDLALARKNLEADTVRARQGVAGAKAAMRTNIATAGLGMGGGRNPLVEVERLQTMAAADQLERDAFYQGKLDGLDVQRNPSLLKQQAPTTYYAEKPYTNPAPQPAPGVYQEYDMFDPSASSISAFAAGGVTELARRVAARRKHGFRLRTGSVRGE